MKLYTLKEAEYLKDYYLSKVIDKIADEKTGLRITSIELEKTNNDLYRINCFGYLINDSQIKPKMSIKTLSEFMNLNSLDIVLQRENQ